MNLNHFNAVDQPFSSFLIVDSVSLSYSSRLKEFKISPL